MKRRVVVTGLGLITPLGIGGPAFADRLFAGAGAIRPITGFDTRALNSHLGAEIVDFQPADFISARSVRRMDRLSQLVTAAARMAFEDAGLHRCVSSSERHGIVMGTAFGATDVASRFAGTLFTEGPRRVNPILVPNTVMNAPAGHAAIELGLKGVNTTVNHREASAETAIACAALQIRLGRADVLLAGGGDILSPFLYIVLDKFMALSPQGKGEERARPFDRRRNGPVAGEGVGLLCLESMESAVSRGATIYCEVAGWGSSAAPAPANDWSDDPMGMIRAMQAAMTMAAVGPDRIDAVFAAASGGIRGDALEARALDRVFGGAAWPAVIAIKGATGENFASGGIRAAALALAIQAGIVPPTLGVTAPILPPEIVSPAARELTVDHGLVNACASGGTFASLVLRRLG